jgi:hypothetical protein
MPLFADQLETCRDIAKRWVIPGSRFCHACRLGRRYRLICGAGIGTRVRGLPIGVNFKGAGVGRPLTGEGARPRAPQRRAKLTDVFRSLDRQTLSASRTIPRPRDGDAIPHSALGPSAAGRLPNDGWPFCGYADLSFHTRVDGSLQEVALEKQEDNQDRQHYQRSIGKQSAPLNRVRSH